METPAWRILVREAQAAVEEAMRICAVIYLWVYEKLIF
jgi:hypothetical protein